MINRSTDHPGVTLSVRVYQALLVIYPAEFRHEYSAPILQVFQDGCRRALCRDGAIGLVKVWSLTLFDLIRSALSEHLQMEFEMKKEMNPEDVRLAGQALISGAVAFLISVLSLVAGEAFISYPLIGLSGLLMIFVSMPLLVVGLFGVRNRFGKQVGWFGNLALLLGVVLGPLINVIGLFGSVTQLYWTDDFNWILTYVGPAVLLSGLALFGFAALYKRPLPRWNIVPLIAGIWYPISIFSRTVIWARTGVWAHGSPDFAMVAVLDLIQGLALVALGYILKSDAPQEMAVPA